MYRVERNMMHVVTQTPIVGSDCVMDCFDTIRHGHDTSHDILLLHQIMITLRSYCDVKEIASNAVELLSRVLIDRTVLY